MKKIALAGWVAVLWSASAAVQAQESPKPSKEHQWLERFVGEWEGEVETVTEPGKPPFKSKTTGKAHMIGAFWVVQEGKADLMGQPFVRAQIIGYDPQTSLLDGLQKTWEWFMANEDEYLSRKNYFAEAGA